MDDDISEIANDGHSSSQARRLNVIHPCKVYEIPWSMGGYGMNSMSQVLVQ